ncbi:hypothetical protein [Dyella sp. C9]|uniref:hypothetical protein n=1 Tax=Dyella sp. C9 TaxID=2202154 RepID=UPI000DEF6A5E|nr:hypothetical protein [Dyella sp. C9]
MGTLVAYFFGGFFLANAWPHLLSGMMGRSFPSPFAKPRGRGPSSPTVNVLWAFANLVFAYLLTVRVGNFQWHDASSVIALGVGALLCALYLAHHFGQVFEGRQTDPA